MAESIENKKEDSKTKNEVSQTAEKKEAYATQSKIGLKTLIESRFFAPAIKIMYTVEDLEIEREIKHNKVYFLTQ